MTATRIIDHLITYEPTQRQKCENFLIDHPWFTTGLFVAFVEIVWLFILRLEGLV